MSTAVQQYLDSTVTLNGQDVPIFEWTVDVGTYGAIGHAVCKTSITALQAAGVDIPSITSGSAKTPVQVKLNGTLMFGGNYTHGWFHFHMDEAEFVCRDMSSVLADTKRSLADLNYQNQTVSQLVDQIATQYGLGVDINITNDPMVGAIVDGDGGAANSAVVMQSKPQTLWNLIVFLARMVGANVWCEPDGTLTMHDAGADEGSNNYTWMPTPDPTGGSNVKPIMELDILHQPERNKNFTVKVISYHGPSCQVTQQTVDVDGELIAVDSNSKVTAGKFTASVGGGGGVLSSSGLGKPEYIKIIDGLTPDQAQKRAEGIAMEIAKKLLVVTAVVDGSSGLKPRQSFLIDEGTPGALLGFKNLPLFISTVQHRYSVPQSDSIGSEGFLSTVKCLNVPQGVGGGDE